jgi:outer membrane protein
MKICFLIIVMALSLSLFSQEKGQDTRVFTLNDCINVAQENNPEIKLSLARMSGTSAELTGAFGEFLPSIGANVGYRRTFAPDQGMPDIPDSLIKPNQYTSIRPNFYSFDIGFQYTLFNGFNRENNYKRIKENYNSFQQSLQFTRDRITSDINRLFVQTILNAQILKIRKENYELGLKELERVKARYEAGVISVNFIYSQEADLGNRELEVVQAESNLRIAKSNLLIVMGLNPETEADFSSSGLPENVSSDDMKNFRIQIGNFESAVSLAFKNRKDIQALQSSLKSTEYQVSMASSSYYPSLTASGGWAWSNYYVKDFSKLGTSFVGLNLQIPIFENFRTNTNVEMARLQQYQSEINLYNAEQSLRQSLRTAMLTLQTAEKQLEITEKSLVSAQKNYEFSNERYKVGTASVTDYFVANNMLVTTQINRISAIYTYFMAQRDVLFALGLLK